MSINIFISYLIILMISIMKAEEIKAEEIKAEVSLVTDGTLQSLNCNNCFILEKKLDRSRKWNRFFKEKLINIDKILHILREFELEKQKNLDLQLAYDQRSREWEDQQQELIRMFSEIQPLRERVKVAEEAAEEERKLRIRLQDTEKSLNCGYQQLLAQISKMRMTSDPMYAEGLEKKLAVSRAENKKLRNNIECCHVEISELRLYSSSNHSQIEKLHKKLYMILCIVKNYGELLQKENDEEWDLVLESLEDVTETLHCQYKVYFKEQINRLKGRRLEQSLIPAFEEWVYTFEVKPIPIFKEELLQENVEPSDTELEAIEVERILTEETVKNVAAKKGKSVLSASFEKVPIDEIKREKVTSNSSTKKSIVEKGKRNGNKSKDLITVKTEMGSLKDASKNKKNVTSPKSEEGPLKVSPKMAKNVTSLRSEKICLINDAKKLKNVTSPRTKNLDSTDVDESNAKSVCSEKILPERVGGASYLLEPLEKEPGMPNLCLSSPVHKLKEVPGKNFVNVRHLNLSAAKKGAELVKLQSTQSESLLKTGEKAFHTKLNECQEDKFISDSSDDEMVSQPRKRRKVLVKSYKITPKNLKPIELESNVKKLPMVPPKDSSLFAKKIEVCKAKPVKCNETPKFVRSHILDVDLHMSESETSESEIDDTIKTPIKEQSFSGESVCKSSVIINKNEIFLPNECSGKLVEKLPMDPPTLIPVRVDKVDEEAKTRREIKKIIEEMSISPIHHFTPFSDESSSDDEEVKPKRLLIKARRGSQGFKPSVSKPLNESKEFKPSLIKTSKEESGESKNLPDTNDFSNRRITRSKSRLSLSEKTNVNKSDENSDDGLWAKRKYNNSKPRKMTSTSTQLKPADIKCKELVDIEKPLPSPKKRRSGTACSKFEKSSKIKNVHETPAFTNNVHNEQGDQNKVPQCSTENEDNNKSHNVHVNSSMFDISISMCSDLEDSPRNPTALKDVENITTAHKRKLESLFGYDDVQEKNFESKIANAGKDIDSSALKTKKYLQVYTSDKTAGTTSDFHIKTDYIRDNSNKVPTSELNLSILKKIKTAKFEFSTHSLIPVDLPPNHRTCLDATSENDITIKESKDVNSISSLPNNNILNNCNKSGTDCRFVKSEEPAVINAQSLSNIGLTLDAKISNVIGDRDEHSQTTLTSAISSITEPPKAWHKMETNSETVLFYDKASLGSYEAIGISMAQEYDTILLDQKVGKISIFESTNVNENQNGNSLDSHAVIKYSNFNNNDTEASDSKLIISMDDQVVNDDDAHSNYSSLSYDGLAMDVSFSEQNLNKESFDSDKASSVITDTDETGKPQYSEGSDVSDNIKQEELFTSEVKNASIPDCGTKCSIMTSSNSLSEETENVNANTGVSMPVSFNFYKERMGNLDETQEYNMPSPVLIQCNDEMDPVLIGNVSQVNNQDDSCEEMELKLSFIHSPIQSTIKLEGSCVNYKEIKACFDKIFLSVHRDLELKNKKEFFYAIDRHPSQDSSTKVQPFVRCVISKLLEMDFMENNINYQHTPETIGKCLEMSLLLEINFRLPEFYVVNLINMSAHKLIINKTLMPNSLSSLTAWFMTSFFKQYRPNWKETKEDENLVYWARTFIVDLLFHNVGTAHKAILTAINSSGKKAFIRMIKLRKASTLEEAIFWIIHHGKHLGDKITLTTLLGDLCNKVGLRKVPHENPEELIKAIIQILTAKNPEKDDLFYASSSLLLLLQWAPSLTSHTIFTQLPLVMADEGEESDRADLSAIKAIFSNLANKCTWSYEDSNDFHQKLDAELAKLFT